MFNDGMWLGMESVWLLIPTDQHAFGYYHHLTS